MTPRGILKVVAGGIFTIFVVPILSNAFEEWSKTSGLEPGLVWAIDVASYPATQPAFWHAVFCAFGFIAGIFVYWNVNETTANAKKLEIKRARHAGDNALSLAGTIRAILGQDSIRDDRVTAAAVDRQCGPRILSVMIEVRKIGVEVPKANLKTVEDCEELAGLFEYLGQLLVGGHLEEARQLWKVPRGQRVE